MSLQDIAGRVGKMSLQDIEDNDFMMMCSEFFQEEKEPHHRNPFVNTSTRPKIQPRIRVSSARWDEELGMGEIIEHKGSFWTTTRIIRDGKLYCCIEEILFLAERGSLRLLDRKDTTFTINDIYKMVAEGKYGCTWECYQAYMHMKNLGYIIKRHGVPWTLKSKTNASVPPFDPRMEGSDGTSKSELENKSSITEQLNDTQVDVLQPNFDVYFPDSVFKKSAPVDPSFVLSLCRAYPPSKIEVKNLEKKCHGIPLKLCFVDHGCVYFFSFDKIKLPTLP